MYSSKKLKMYATGGNVTLFGPRRVDPNPPPFIDFNYVSGIPPLPDMPKFASGGIVANIERNLKKNKFQR
jgi:hypothetical protein